MSIPNLHTTIDYKKLIELQARECQEMIPVAEKDVKHMVKVKQKNVPISNRCNTKKR